MAAATGDAPVTGPQTPPNEFGFVNDELAELYKRAQFRLKTYAGTADAITAEGDPFNINVINGGTNALLDGQLIAFAPPNANTAKAPTLAVDAVAAKTIVDPYGNPLFPGEIRGDAPQLLQYEATPDKLRMVPALGGYFAGVQSNEVQSHTGDTTETTLATVTAPGGKLGANGRLRISMLGQGDGGAGNVQFRIKFGGTIFANINIPTTQSGRLYTEIGNRNATNSQVGGPNGAGVAGWNVFTGDPVTAALDTTLDQDITITAALTVGTDTAKLDSYAVELWHQA